MLRQRAGGINILYEIEFEKVLKKSGLKNTRPRIEILSVIKEKSFPVSAEDIFLTLKDKNISINLSTVYRTLEALAVKNIVSKFKISNESHALYEYNEDKHRHYLICLGCKSIRAIDYCPLKDYEQSLEERTNYKIQGHKLNIYGYCPDCIRSDKTEKQ